MEITVVLDKYQNLIKIYASGESPETVKLKYPDWDADEMFIYLAPVKGTRNNSNQVHAASYRDKKFIGLFWNYDEAKQSYNEVVVRSYQI